MSFAFPALLIVLLVLPGVLLRYAYLRGSWGANSPFVPSGLSDEIASGLVFAILLHIGWGTLLGFFGVRIDLKSVLVLLTGGYGRDQQLLLPAIRSATDYPHYVAFYFAGLYLISLSCGMVAHTVVRRWRLDRKYPPLRFRNDWHYLFTGETPELLNDPRTVDFVYISTIVKAGDHTFLYHGILSDYFFGSDGSLDRIVLVSASRRQLSEDRRPEEQEGAGTSDSVRFYSVLGNYFVIRYSEMQTLNIAYSFVTERDHPADEDRISAEGGYGTDDIP